MAYDPLTASYLATVPEAPPIQAPTPQSMMALQQMAGQLAIQKQVQAENDLKLRAAAEDRQDDETFQKAYKANVLKAQGASTAPLSNAGQTQTTGEDQDAGTAGVPVASATPASQSTPPSEDTIWDQTLAQLRGQLHVRNAVKYQNEQLEHQKAVLSLTQAQREMAKDNADTIGNILLGAYQATDPAQKNQLYQTALRQAQSRGMDMGTLPQQLPNDDSLAGLVAAYRHGADVINWANKKAQTQRDLEAAQRAKEQAAREQAVADRTNYQNALEDAARGFLGVTNQDQMDAAVARVPDNLKPLFANMTQYSDDNLAKIQSLPLTGEQRSGAGFKQQTATLNQQKVDNALSLGDERLKLLQDRLNFLESKQGQVTPAQRQSMQREISTTNQAEDALYGTNGRLASAISSGSVFVDRLGNEKPIATDAATKAQQIADMRAQYDANTRKLKDLIQTKNSLADQLGFPYQVSTAQAHAALDAGNQLVQQGGAPRAASANAPKTQTSQAATKTTSMAQVKAFADQKFAGDINKAKDAVKAQGYKISDEK